MSESGPQEIGRYALFGEIASGGMASVHYGRVAGPAGFARTVAIKRLHPHLAKEPEFVAMLLDEARLTARIRHPNVASVVDVVVDGQGVLLVMDYVHGESLSRLMRAAVRDSVRPGLDVISGIMVPALHGLHAAHTAKSETGQPLRIVHRDFTPQNLLVGQDGVPRIVDFGVARAVGRLQATREGQLKGKPAYMAPEQILTDEVDARTDLFAAAIMLWELLTMRRLFAASNDAAAVNRVLTRIVDPPSRVVPDVPRALDAVVMKGLARERKERWQTAEEMAHALEAACTPGSATIVGGWVRLLAGDVLEERAATVSSVETGTPSFPLKPAPAVEGTGTALTSDSNRSHRPRRALRGVALGIGAVALLGAGILIGGRSCSAGPEPSVAAGPASTLGSVGRLSSASPVVGAAAAPAASASSATPSASQPAAEGKPPVASGTPAAKVTAKPAHPKKPAAAANCKPPYVVDERGVVRWKRECLDSR
ncbi:MAG TPA: serine/threonine-protein kinase [Polyangiaceae bacterium]|nr:serine/threonine-protein kinase [Polyangiaceae bacterium]